VSCWEAFASDITFTECMRSPPALALTHVDAHAAESSSPCSPRRHGVAMMVCFVHAAAGGKATPLRSLHARLTAGTAAHPRALVPGRGSPTRRHRLHRPELRLGQDGPTHLGKG
jgi:hypothetical protein